MEREERIRAAMIELDIQLDIINIRLYYRLQQLAMEAKHELSQIKLEKIK